jgi:uncharacterized protein (TIGR02453 family)
MNLPQLWWISLGLATRLATKCEEEGRMFTGFQPELFTFLRGLSAQTSKTWFDTERGNYERYYKEAAQDFIADVSRDMAALKPALQAVPKVNGSLRRINRDVRFSKDKTPYHTYMHLVFWAGDHPNRSAGMHVIIEADGIGYGAGHFGMTPDVLAAYRAAVLKASKRIGLLSALEEAARVGSTLEAPQLQRLPKGYQAEDDWEHLLRYKAVVARTQTPHPHPDWLTNGDHRAGLLALTKAHLPLIDWLHRLS